MYLTGPLVTNIAGLLTFTGLPSFHVCTLASILFSGPSGRFPSPLSSAAAHSLGGMCKTRQEELSFWHWSTAAWYCLCILGYFGLHAAKYQHLLTPQALLLRFLHHSTSSSYGSLPAHHRAPAAGAGRQCQRWAMRRLTSPAGANPCFALPLPALEAVQGRRGA